MLDSALKSKFTGIYIDIYTGKPLYYHDDYCNYRSNTSPVPHKFGSSLDNNVFLYSTTVQHKRNDYSLTKRPSRASAYASTEPAERRRLTTMKSIGASHGP